MRITPLDIIQKQFSGARGRGGYEPDEVRAFLDQVRDTLEDVLRENQRLREEVNRREAEVAELRGGESDLKSTLLLAKRLSDDLKDGARREADVIVGEARLEAERILMATAEERRELQAELLSLSATRARLVADLRAAVEVAGKVVDDIGAGGPGR
ncbi:MAG: DivIVA domain-containing protein [Deltaproteobacteria bacterium]|jgi:cell division initiation protein|nr:DivIVA domain-containing protein [Deltaproteobacteria bacterium]